MQWKLPGVGGNVMLTIEPVSPNHVIHSLALLIASGLHGASGESAAQLVAPARKQELEVDLSQLLMVGELVEETI